MKYRELLKLLKNDKSVLALAYTGSYGLGYQDKYSDIDILVLITDSSSFGEFIKRYNKRGLEIHPHLELMENLSLIPIKLDHLRVELKIMQLRELRNITNRKEISDLALFIRDIRIIHDPHKLLGNARRTKYPIEKGKFELRLLVYPLRIKEFVNIALERKDYLYLNSVINQTIENIVKAVFALNKREYPSVKWAFKNLAKFKLKPKNFQRRLLQITRLRNAGRELKLKVNLLFELGKETYQLAIVKYPEMKKLKEHINWVRF